MLRGKKRRQRPCDMEVRAKINSKMSNLKEKRGEGNSSVKAISLQLQLSPEFRVEREEV